LRRSLSEGGQPNPKQRKLSAFGVASVADATVASLQHIVETDMGRLIYAKDLPFGFAEEPLVQQLIRSVLKAGKAGMTLPSAADLADPSFAPRRLTLMLPKRGRVGRALIDEMHSHGVATLKGRTDHLVDRCVPSPQSVK